MKEACYGYPVTLEMMFMPRRRRGSPYQQSSMSAGTDLRLTNGTPQYGAASNYEDAVEPTHNGNFAWNGQPIPQYAAQNQGGNSTANPNAQFIPQARNTSTQTFSGSNGGMPIPGSSGDPQAEYGRRNTGINNADARNVGFQGGYTGYGANGQPVQYGTFMRDGTQYGKGPHTIDPNKKIISAVRYSEGGISAVKFQDGSVADIAQAIAMAEADMIEDVNTGKNREGQKTLRSYPDGDPSNNLSNLPRF
jgi:hypothetical protein